ncbi:ABC transporter substrate-binding protein [Bradyrhizobium arachidis]|uniref:ABC transporter substrate-binding protein n=1 Tax=Bradyrhizobium arachidis TaxID=858423 RepID=UPI002162DF90|nr:ABC transporter substrate-binding protein [Bradyrhizobium arachidis]UVO31429.1 ABC transporter substrate-binding protein [Bradyrhizobium arachidis]
MYCPLAGIFGLAAYVFLGALAFAQEPGTGQNAETGRPQVSLVVKTTTDLSEAADLVSEFTKLNPSVAVEYSKVLSTDLFDQVVKSSGTKGAADVVWSSSMDLQIKLANDGYAAEYHSAEADGIFGWARWKDRAYGVTAEPVVIVYNKRLLREGQVPKDHAELLRLLTDHLPVFQGKIATYDPELSGTGLLFITQDVRVTAQTWKLVAAMGRAKVKLYSSSGPMIDRVSSGELVLAYNVLGSYALERAKRDQDIGIVFPSDYTLLLSRIALIPQSAQQPELARRFVDFLLSRSGQALLARHSLGSVREDMKPTVPGSADAKIAARPIALSIDLLTYLDQAKRERFLKDWKKFLQER